MAPRQLTLLLLLAGTLAAVWWVGQEEGADTAEVVGAATPGRQAGTLSLIPGPSPQGGKERVLPSPAGGGVGGEGGRVAEKRFAASGPDLFPVQSFRPPPPPPRPLPPPPPPQAPQLPYKYLGRWEEDGLETIFLAEGNRTRAVHQGDRLGQWRVEAIRGDVMTLVYLPLDQTRTLRLAP